MDDPRGEMFRIRYVGDGAAYKCGVWSAKCFCGYGIAKMIYYEGKGTQEAAKEMLCTHLALAGGYDRHLEEWVREAYGSPTR